MERTTTIDRDTTESPALWPVVLQAFAAAVFVGSQVLRHWGHLDSLGRLLSLLILGGLVLDPSVEMWRRRSGKEVRFNHLAIGAYGLVWLTVVMFSLFLMK